MTARAGQGMRQPQLGGVNGDLSKQGIGRASLCAHTAMWRKSPEHPWRCAVCHPPAEPATAQYRVLEAV